MARISKLLDDQVVLIATEGLKKIGNSGLVARKLQAIISSKKHGITKTAEFYSTTKSSIIKWIKDLKQESLAALEVQAGRGRKRLITNDQELEIRKWISEDCNITIEHLRQKILENMGAKLSKSTTHRIMQKLEFSYITPRPIHYKQEQKLKDEFKKKSSN